jgi:hypothetical protein
MISGRLGPVELRIVTPESDRVAVHIEWLFDSRRSHGRETLLGEPSRELDYGVRACPVVGVAVEANDDTVSLE